MLLLWLLFKYKSISVFLQLFLCRAAEPHCLTLLVLQLIEKDVFKLTIIIVNTECLASGVCRYYLNELPWMNWLCSSQHLYNLVTIVISAGRWANSISKLNGSYYQNRRHVDLDVDIDMDMEKDNHKTVSSLIEILPACLLVLYDLAGNWWQQNIPLLWTVTGAGS